MQSGANPISYTLPAAMTAETADMLAEVLTQLELGSKPFLTLDASAVEHLSTCGAQLLVSLEKTIQAAEGELFITGQNDLLTRLFSEMGLSWFINHLR